MEQLFFIIMLLGVKENTPERNGKRCSLERQRKRKKLTLNKMPTLELKNIMLEIKSTV